MKRIISILILSLLAASVLGAQEKQDTLNVGGQNKARPELRLGWGDPMFESAVWYKSSEKTDYRYSGHSVRLITESY